MRALDAWYEKLDAEGHHDCEFCDDFVPIEVIAEELAVSVEELREESRAGDFPLITYFAGDHEGEFVWMLDYIVWEHGRTDYQRDMEARS